MAISGSDWLEVPGYLPYIRPIFQGYVRGYPPKIWPTIWYSTSILGSWNSHWFKNEHAVCYQLWIYPQIWLPTVAPFSSHPFFCANGVIPQCGAPPVVNWFRTQLSRPSYWSYKPPYLSLGHLEVRDRKMEWGFGKTKWCVGLEGIQTATKMLRGGFTRPTGWDNKCWNMSCGGLN